MSEIISNCYSIVLIIEHSPCNIRLEDTRIFKDYLEMSTEALKLVKSLRESNFDKNVTWTYKEIPVIQQLI